MANAKASMTPANTTHNRTQMPILARHAVSLAVAFVMGLVLSYFAAQFIHQQIQLNKLTSTDQATFERGVGYVVTQAGTSEAVTTAALNALDAIDASRAADVLLAIAHSHAEHEDPAEPVIPQAVTAKIAPLMKRLAPMQAIGLYDGLVQIKGINPITTAESLLNSLTPEDDAQLLLVVDLLDTRLLWSRRWAPLDLWVRWLGLLAQSDSELTQAQTAKRLGELPQAVDDPRVIKALTALSKSEYDTVRNLALKKVAAYAAIAKDPTDYEQILFNLGSDANKIIARRAWMIVGHLNPSSGFAVNWQDADPFVAEAMLWAAVKTNPENPQPVRDAINQPDFAKHAFLASSASATISYPQISESGKRLVLSDDHSNLITVWRAILARQAPAEHDASWARFLGSYLDEDAQPAAMFSLSLASIYRTQSISLPDPFRWTTEQLATGELAAVEGRFLEAATEQRPVLQNQYTISKLISAVYATQKVAQKNDLNALIGEIPLDQPVLPDLFTLALTRVDSEGIDRFIRSSHPQLVPMAAMASVMKGYQPRLVKGVNADFLRQHPDLTDEQIRAMTDAELSDLGLSRIDALPALLDAAQSAPPSANRSAQAKLLQLAMWMRGDLGDGFTPTAEAMLFDDEVPTSTVLMSLLYMQRPIALNYLFGDLATPRPDLYQLFIQERYWHVFRRFVDTSDLTLWLWGDPEAQAFQLEAMAQWYAVNRWKIEQGWWPELIYN